MDGESTDWLRDELRSCVNVYGGRLFPELDEEVLTREYYVGSGLSVRGFIEEHYGELTAQQRERVEGTDRVVVEWARTIVPVLRTEGFLDSRDDKPLESWWLWLDRIADGTYPSELLPEHLRNVEVRTEIYITPRRRPINPLWPWKS